MHRFENALAILCGILRLFNLVFTFLFEFLRLCFDYFRLLLGLFCLHLRRPGKFLQVIVHLLELVGHIFEGVLFSH